ncbi:DUF202 domain-containing protein [Nocardioides sp. R1-1]|uniref:DUF202 domain-containing protein n=1 Tax=Nocardioides sp. R1-1 TaxID=3383502 RepID=UPI0038D041AA
MSGAPCTDRSLQNERTALAWRRTALSLLVATATIAKVTSLHEGVLAWAWLLVGIPGALAVLVMSTRTYQARRVDAAAVSPWPPIAASALVSLGAGVLSIVTILGVRV